MATLDFALGQLVDDVAKPLGGPGPSDLGGNVPGTLDRQAVGSVQAVGNVMLLGVVVGHLKAQDQVVGLGVGLGRRIAVDLRQFVGLGDREMIFRHRAAEHDLGRRAARLPAFRRLSMCQFAFRNVTPGISRVNSSSHFASGSTSGGRLLGFLSSTPCNVVRNESGQFSFRLIASSGPSLIQSVLGFFRSGRITSSGRRIR